MKKQLLLTSILVTMISNFSIAEENIPVQKLNETVIRTTESFGTKTRETVKNIQVITADEIKLRGASTVQEALKGVPGVDVRGYDGGFLNIDLRGGGAATGMAYSNLLLDGVPFGGLTRLDMNTIPVEEIEKIEIIQGGGAVTHGDGTTGGIVNIITKSPKDKKLYGNINLEAGSWKTKKASFNLGTKVTDKLALEASYFLHSTREYRDRGYGVDWKGNAYDYRDKNDKKESVWLKGKYKLTDGQVTLKYNHSELIDIFTGSIPKEDFDKNPKKAGDYNGRLKSKIDNFSLALDKKFNEDIGFAFSSGYTKAKNKYDRDSETKIKEFFIKPELKYNYAKDSYAIVGLDYKDGKTQNITEKLPKNKRESFAMFLTNKFTYGDFQFTQGYRTEKVKYSYPSLGKIVNKEFKNNNTFELGFNYLYSPTGNMYLNYTRALRTPSITEVNLWLGDIKTQKNDIFEIGLREYFSNTDINVSAFYITSKDEIYYHKKGWLPGASYPGANKNFDGKVRRTGAQLSLNHNFGKFNIREKISYLDAKVTSGIYKGKEFAGVAKWTFNLGVTYNITDNFYVNADLYHKSSFYAEDDFDNEFSKFSGATTVDLNASYHFENGIEVYGGAKNLFNKKYASTGFKSNFGTSFAPANGRNVYVGFKYKF